MATKINKNERSWGIELISLINKLADDNDLVIKRAGGESTISNGKDKVMFPDVILYGDRRLSSIIQGWELKMPDVPITDSAFVKDAHRKAKILNLSSCVIWNFTYAKFYVYNTSSSSFEAIKIWENSHIKTRGDVETYRQDWEETLKDVVLTVNAYLANSNIASLNVGDLISQNAIDALINDNKELVADCLRTASVRNTPTNALISVWWDEVKQEYSFDEVDKFKAYAKTIILNWAFRIIFAHLIKRYQKEAFRVEKIGINCTPAQANKIFDEITQKCDFYNIFAPISLNEIMPQKTWDSLIELSIFLNDNGIDSIEQSMLQNILEKCIAINRRVLNGQFTTPRILAEILASITMHDLTGNCLDPCCGTGTIISEVLKKKKRTLTAHQAVATTWAGDKYQVPLQIASLSMASSDTINDANMVFQKNALSLRKGDIVSIVDPSSGTPISYELPEFITICSNLPFLSFENIGEEDKKWINRNLPNRELDSKSDLSYYIAVHLASLLRENGYIGLILSNAWLGTNSGTLFYKEITKHLSLKQVHISGDGRWFHNADVVTTILIFQKQNTDKNTSFFIWKKPLELIEKDESVKNIIVNSSLLNRAIDSNIISIASYSESEIENIHSLGLSYNSLFNNVNWLLSISDKLCPINSLFKVFRGSRRGWDKLFFPENGGGIENKFLHPALFNAKAVKYLYAEPDKVAFSCSESIEVLKNHYKGAYNWIKSFEHECNGIGKPLPQVLQRSTEYWYEMKPNEVTELFTMMNPDDRFFFGRFKEMTFINQRLIGLNKKTRDIDIELCHALLNSILEKFFIEAVGFGRGLGALDINKENVSNCLMLNPKILTTSAINRIKDKFKVICGKAICSIDDELKDSDWQEYNHIVLEAYGIDHYYDDIANSLTSMRRVRKAVKNI